MGKLVPSHWAQRVNKSTLGEDGGEIQNNEEGNSQNLPFSSPPGSERRLWKERENGTFTHFCERVVLPK